MPAPTTKAIRGVELVSTGTWAASTGVTKITRTDLESMLAAAADPAISDGPIKLGHASSLNDGIGDGAPAYGWVRATKIVDKPGGVSTLVGDLLGMPAMLADVAPTANRRRSVEIAWNLKAGGKTYTAALVGVALLGATPPAVKGLADLVSLHANAAAAESVDTLTVVEGLEGNPVAVAMLTAAAGAGAPDAQLDAMAAAAGARDTGTVPPPVSETPNDDTHDQHGAPGATRNPGGTATMPTMTDEQLRDRLGLEQDADVRATLANLLSERPEQDPAQEPAPVQEPAAPAPAPAPAAPAAPVEPTPAEGAEQVATLSTGTLAALQRDAAWAREQRRKQVLDTAATEGRIAPADRAHFAAMLERDEEGTTTLLSSLSPMFATSELGSSVAGDAAPDSDVDAALTAWESGQL